MDITENIKQAIKLHGFTGVEVAEKLGVAQSQFSRLINNPNIKYSELRGLSCY